MKRKTLTIAISFFALIAIVSVGFASWVISRPTQNKDVQGNITVESVSKSSTNLISSVTITNNQSLHLGVPTADDMKDMSDNPNKYLAEADRWFSYNASTVECLSVEVVVELYEELDTSVDKLTIKLEKGKIDGSNFVSGNEEFVSAVNSNYITDLSISGNNDINENGVVVKSTSETTGEGESATTKHYVKFNITIGWGNAFGEMNPYLYYNLASNGFSKDNAEAAENALKALETAMKNASFKVIVTLAANSK